MDKRIKNYLLNTARTPVKTRVDIGAPEGYIESNTGKSARQGNLRYTRVRFQSFADEARDFPVLHFLPVFDLIFHFVFLNFVM